MNVIMNKKYEYTPEMIEALRAKFPITNSKELANHLNCSYGSVNYYAQKLGLKKDIEYIREVSRLNMLREDHPAKKYWIKKGSIPVNKGKKQTEFMTEKGIEKSKATRFRKGQTAINHKPVGYERINVEGYVEVKVSEPNIFKLKHRVIWEQIHGEIPKGHNVQFRDGNRKNFEINNLYLISRYDQFKNENSLHARYSGELKKSIYALSNLKKQIRKHEKSDRN